MGESINYNSYPYATIGRRVIATVLDQTIIISLMFLIGFITKSFPKDLEAFKVILFFSPLLFYNPLMVSAFGNTVFQKIFRIKIVRENRENCPFYLAILRWIVEVLLGWISIVYFMFNDKHQTIHDKVAGTVVYYLGKEKNEAEHIKPETDKGKIEFEYPSAGRRFLFFFIWYIPSQFILNFILVIILMIAGVNIEVETSEKYFNIVSFVLFFGVIILAVKGLLPGAMRKKVIYIEEENQN
jgi:uncharacterized RDD family membrane protein YckC